MNNSVQLYKAIKGVTSPDDFNIRYCLKPGAGRVWMLWPILKKVLLPVIVSSGFAAGSKPKNGFWICQEECRRIFILPSCKQFSANSNKHCHSKVVSYTELQD